MEISTVYPGKEKTLSKLNRQHHFLTNPVYQADLLVRGEVIVYPVNHKPESKQMVSISRESAVMALSRSQLILL